MPNPPPSPLSWMTPSFIKEVLHHCGIEESHIQTLEITDPTCKGDHYKSILLRIKMALKGTAHQPSFIIKSTPFAKYLAETIKTSLDRESLMLSDLLPKMHALTQAKAPGRFSPFAPKYIHHGNDPVPFVVMEDLMPENFRPADRVQGLDLAESILAVRTLGRFHGASYAVLTQNPHLADVLVHGLLQPTADLKSFVRTGFESIATMSFFWTDFPVHLKLTLDNLTDTAIEGFSKLANPSSSSFNVILHNNTWTNNMLFRYDGGQPIDMRFVDFQTAAVGPAVLDFLNLLNTSLEEKVSEHSVDLLTTEYYKSLAETMKLLELDPPTFTDLKREIDEHGFYSLLGAICVAPIVRAPRDARVLLRCILKGDTEKNIKIYSHPNIDRFLKRVLPLYRDKGWLSINK